MTSYKKDPYDADDEEIKMFRLDLERQIQITFMEEASFVDGYQIVYRIPVEKGFHSIEDQYLPLYCYEYDEEIANGYLGDLLSIYAEFCKSKGRSLERLKENRLNNFLLQAEIIQLIQ
jgi:hypothetical protein